MGARGSVMSETMLMAEFYVALAAAIIPAYLFVRRMMGGRIFRPSAAWIEAKRQFDLAIWIFLGLVGCVVAIALGKLAWGWWS